jgi:hypothetical protein
MIDRRDFLKVSAAACFRPQDAVLADGVVELRNYLLTPGSRGAFTALFEKTFVDSQEALGTHILGVFEDLNAPDRFVWMRGWTDMAVRLKALTGFYGGELWKAHRNEANAMILDSDDVYLLKPGAPACWPKGLGGMGAAMLAVDVYAHDTIDESMVAAAQAAPGFVAQFVSHEAKNDFPRLPVHSDRVVVFVRRFDAVGSPDAVITSVVPVRRHRLTAR